MSGLVLERDGTVGIFYSVTSTIDDTFGDNVRSEITPPMIASLPRARRKKIIRLRQQLARGTYDLDERLDAVLERILMDITP
jgi:putative ubiquitin-RnfH superfamily antitoxin RatB of RatAB toxin-antitoxin module